MTVLCVVLAALAAALLCRPGRRPGGDAALRPLGLRPVVVMPVVLAGASAALLLWLDGRRLALALIVLGCAAATAQMAARGRLARVADRRRAAVVEVAETLAGELRAGQPLLAALERCTETWAGFEPVAAAGRLGADVPAAMRRLARLPGAEGLAEIATAWQVSHSSGAGLSTALGQVTATARARQSTRHVVAAELASARATARLVALLPVGVLLMAAGVGGRPWQFLLASPAGLACLAAGAALAFTGLWWIDRIAAGVLRR